MNRSKGSSSRRTFLRLAALLLPAGALLGSLPGVRAAARPRKLYLAGPDVFRADAVAHGEALKALCARYGFEGLYPLAAVSYTHLDVYKRQGLPGAGRYDGCWNPWIGSSDASCRPASRMGPLLSRIMAGKRRAGRRLSASS